MIALFSFDRTQERVVEEFTRLDVLRTLADDFEHSATLIG
jgi:hypothetical protein